MSAQQRPPRQRPTAATTPTRPQQIDTTLGALAAAAPAFSRLLGRQLPVKAAYTVAKLATLVQAELRIYDAQRLKWVSELGAEREPTAEEVTTNGPGPITSVTAANWSEFQHRLTQLGEQRVVIPWRPLQFSEIGEQAIAPGDLVALGPLIALDGEKSQE